MEYIKDYDKWLEYDFVHNFFEGYAKIKKGGRCNRIDKKGQLLTSKRYKEGGDFHEGLAWIKEDGLFFFLTNKGKYNRINKNNTIISKERYNEVGDFHEGFAKVKLKGKRNWIDKNGSLKDSQWYEEAGDFHEGFAKVKLKGKRNWIDKNGNLKDSQWYEEIGDFHEGLAKIKIKRNGNWNWIDKNGNLLTKDGYDMQIGDFHEGLAKIKIKRNGNWNWIDKNGNNIYQNALENIYGLGDFHEGLAWVIYNEDKNWIDKNGRKLLQSNTYKKVNGFGANIGDFCDGFAKIGIDDQNKRRETDNINKATKRNWIDKNGNLKDSQWYEEIGDFHEGLAWIKYNGKYNWININGSYLFKQDIKSEIISNNYQEDKEIIQKNNIDKVEFSTTNKKSIIQNNDREKLRYIVLQARGSKCEICNSTNNLDVHHVLPRHMGGKDEIENLQIVCRNCHKDIHGHEIGSSNSNEIEKQKRELSNKLKKIYDAVHNDKKIFIVYQGRSIGDQAGPITKRTIIPERLAYENRKQYLFAYCELRSERRQFRIARIMEIEIR